MEWLRKAKAIFLQYEVTELGSGSCSKEQKGAILILNYGSAIEFQNLKWYMQENEEFPLGTLNSHIMGEIKE